MKNPELVVAPEAALTLRVPHETLSRIDTLVRCRPSKIPRHSWLLEAIYEKLEKEERTRGCLEISRWGDRNSPEPRLYRLRFLRDDRPRRRPVVPKLVIGLDAVERHLIDWGISPDAAKQWLSVLASERSVQLPDVLMAAESVGKYGFKMQDVGIHLSLENDRTAMLIPDSGRGPEGKGLVDQLIIFDSDGSPAKEAFVASDGKVFSISWYTGPPNTGSHIAEEILPAESLEFLAIYKKFVPDFEIDELERLARESTGNSRGWKFNREELHERKPR